MASYRVIAPDGAEAGIRVECEAHGESETFEPAARTVAFHCAACDVEVGVQLTDTERWWEATERC